MKNKSQIQFSLSIKVTCTYCSTSINKLWFQYLTQYSYLVIMLLHISTHFFLRI